MKHIVSFSGGAGSIATLKLLLEKHSKKDILCLFADTKMEHEDLYASNKKVQNHFGVEFVDISDGRTVWEVFADVGYQGNTRVDPCSRILKRDLIAKWLKNNYNPSYCFIYVGIDCTEEHRLMDIVRRNAPFKYRSALVENEVFMTTNIKKEIYKELGMPLPLMYQLGLSHNNCAGFCVKAGLGHYYNLYKGAKDLYMEHESNQEKLIKENPKLDKPFLRKTIKGELHYITLKEYREKYIESITEDEKLDMGSCGCTS